MSGLVRARGGVLLGHNNTGVANSPTQQTCATFEHAVWGFFFSGFFFFFYTPPFFFFKGNFLRCKDDHGRGVAFLRLRSHEQGTLRTFSAPGARRVSLFEPLWRNEPPVWTSAFRSFLRPDPSAFRRVLSAHSNTVNTSVPFGAPR